MNDSISRQSVLNILLYFNPPQHLEMIKKLPSADAVEVVRCKDCKWYEAFYTLNGNEFRCCCREGTDRLRNSDDYCSYGERKYD